MLSELKHILLDFQETALNTGTPRRLCIETVAKKATVCIGVRRSGKSTFLFQIIGRLLASGVPRENILFLNFFDDRLHALQQGDLGKVLEAYFSLYPEKKGAEKIYCFFDEIQAIEHWESFVDRLMRTELCEVYISGSSAQMLSTEIATQMRGRALTWEIFPFSFGEYLDFMGIECQGALSSKRQFRIQKAVNDFWETGGFPEVAGLSRALRLKIHQEYFHAILNRDLVERHDVSHPRALLDLSHRLIDNIASFYTINGLTGYLKSLGHKVPKATVSTYLAWFEDAYFLYTVRLFDASLTRSHANPKKIYCIDHALVTSVASGVLVNAGHLLENLVFVALRRMCADIHYYRTASGREVDFVLLAQDRSRRLVQVCESLADVKTKRREVTALTEAMREQNLREGMIVTRYEAEKIDTDQGVIEVVPLWRFLLDLET